MNIVMAQTGQGGQTGQVLGYIAAGDPSFIMATLMANALATTVRNPDGSTTYIDDSNEPDQPAIGPFDGSAVVNVDSGSMLDRFLDGYQNAPRDIGPGARRVFNTISNIQTFATRMTYENLANASASSAAGWGEGALIFVDGLALEAVVLPATTINFMSEAVKIALGVGNIFNDAY